MFYGIIGDWNDSVEKAESRIKGKPVYITSNEISQIHTSLLEKRTWIVLDAWNISNKNMEALLTLARSLDVYFIFGTYKKPQSFKGELIDLSESDKSLPYILRGSFDKALPYVNAVPSIYGLVLGVMTRTNDNIQRERASDILRDIMGLRVFDGDRAYILRKLCTYSIDLRSMFNRKYEWWM